jgi:hypothetical protein
MPEWLLYLAKGISIFLMMAFSAVILQRAGRSPYYALFWLLPWVQVVLLWVFAFQKWPAVDRS